jgi:phosphatidylserine decarboxylase
MKKAAAILKCGMVCLLLAIISFPISAKEKTSVPVVTSQNSYAPVVASLKDLYDKNADFKNLMNNTLRSAISPLEGWSPDPNDSRKLYVWSEKNIDDLLAFFQSWLTFVPGPNNGMMYYELLYGLCYENTSALRFVSTEPGLSWTKQFVRARGKYMDSLASINDHKVSMEQWKQAMGNDWYSYQPPHDPLQGYYGYMTFNEFFTRNIKKGMRPVSDTSNAAILCVPADGLTNVINENLSTDSKIHTKYHEYLNVEQLLAGSEYAKYFLGGTATGTVLLPDNYHHYHSPAAGMVVESKNLDTIAGVYFGMDGQFFTYLNNGNVGGYLSDYGVFGIYHRGYYIIKTKQFGYIAMIPIGLDDISSINFEDKFSPANVSTMKQVPVVKGEKLGHFAYGGSTVILLFEPGVFDGIKLKQGAQLSILNAKKSVK